jgi:hypothetical protein
MTTRVGLSIGHDALRLMIVQRGKPLWAKEQPREPGPPVVAEIVALLARAPITRLPAPRLNAAVGPHASQVKILRNLPPTSDLDVLCGLVRENAGAFFVKRGGSLVTTGIRLGSDGQKWCAAIETGHVNAVREACSRARIKLGCIAPSAIVLPLAIPSQRFDWTDGAVTLELTAADGNLSSVKRVRKPENAGTRCAQTVNALDCLGDARLVFADAYGAAVAPGNNPLCIEAFSSVQDRQRMLARRLVLPAVISTLATSALLLSPLADVAAARKAQTALRALQASDEWRVTLSVLAEYDRITAVLAELDQFASSRTELTRLLAEIAGRLPEQTALDRLRIEGSEAQLSALSEQPLDAIARVKAVPGVTAAELIGGITRENNGGVDLQRITLRLRLRPPPESAVGRQ